MRSLMPLLVLAAAAGCGSSSSTSNDMQTSGGPDLAASSCGQTVDAYCAAVGNCVRDAGAAQMAATWCPPGGPSTVTSVTVQHCAGGQIVVVATYADSADHLVYAPSMLTAVFNSLPHATTDLVCVAGPTTFAAPSGCDTPTQICP